MPAEQAGQAAHLRGGRFGSEQRAHVEALTAVAGDRDRERRRQRALVEQHPERPRQGRRLLAVDDDAVPVLAVDEHDRLLGDHQVIELRTVGGDGALVAWREDDVRGDDRVEPGGLAGVDEHLARREFATQPAPGEQPGSLLVRDRRIALGGDGAQRLRVSIEPFFRLDVVLRGQRGERRVVGALQLVGRRRLLLDERALGIGVTPRQLIPRPAAAPAQHPHRERERDQQHGEHDEQHQRGDLHPSSQPVTADIPGASPARGADWIRDEVEIDEPGGLHERMQKVPSRWQWCCRHRRLPRAMRRPPGGRGLVRLSCSARLWALYPPADPTRRLLLHRRCRLQRLGGLLQSYLSAGSSTTLRAAKTAPTPSIASWPARSSRSRGAPRTVAIDRREPDPDPTLSRCSGSNIACRRGSGGFPRRGAGPRRLPGRSAPRWCHRAGGVPAPGHAEWPG